MPRRQQAAFVRRARGYSDDERGAIAILVAVLLPVLVGGLGLGAEAGLWYHAQRQLQHAADAASHGAGIRKAQGDDQAAIDTAALRLAVAAGFDAENGTITVNNPPLSGTNAGDLRAVEVLLTRSIPRAFTSIYSREPVTVAARAVALLSHGPSACVLALSPHASAALFASGTTGVALSACESAANSNADDAFDMQGAATYTTGCVYTVGRAEPTSGLTLTDCDSVYELAPVTPDPYKDVAAPEVVGPCSNGKVGHPQNPTTVTPTFNHPNGMKSVHYCNGLELKGVVNLDPGLYIVGGGDLKVNAGAQVTGDGVTFYFTDKAASKLNGNSDLRLTAPTDGPLSGLLFFGDRTEPSIDHHVNGGSSSRFTGAIYFPAQHVTYNGGAGATNGCTQIIGDTITFTGNSSLQIECEGAGTRDIEIAGKVFIVE